MQGGGPNRYDLPPQGMKGGREEREVSTVRKWEDGGDGDRSK